MAQIFGQAGRSAADKSHDLTKRVVTAALLGTGALGLCSGYLLSAAFPVHHFSAAGMVLIGLICGVLIWFIGSQTTEKIDSLDRQRMAWRKGAVGEVTVASILADLPDDFVVVNDVTTNFGNIDHVVIGPTGVYLIDAKNWRGTVRSNGDGELELNGKVPPKPVVKSLLDGVMEFQSKLKAFTDVDHFVRGLLVFPNAYVQANFGSTRQIHCLRTERLIGYLLDKRFSRKLRSSEIDRFKLAKLQLAGLHDWSNNAH